MSRAGLCLVASQPIARETEVSLELVLTFGEDGVSEPLKIDGRVAWCTALFGAYQIGVKFVKVDDERAKYLDMFVGFLDGTLAPGGMLGDADEIRRHAAQRERPIPTIRSRTKIHATRQAQPQVQESRRQHQRVDLRMSAEVRTSETVFTATTRDLSEGGAGLSADRPLDGGQEVAARPLPGGRRRRERHAAPVGQGARRLVRRDATTAATTPAFGSR